MSCLPGRRPSARRLLAAAIVATCLAGCDRSAAPVASVRVIGRPAALLPGVADVDGTRRPTLARGIAEHVLLLDDLPADPVLELAAARSKSDPAGIVRFEASIEAGSTAPVVVFAREQATAVWMEASVDLTPHRADRGRLVLRTTVVDGPPDVLRDAVWAEPVVHSASAPPRRSAILVSIDSLRADRVGVYGATGVRTPVLDALARDGG